MRILFLGSPPFATPILERVLSSRHRVVALVTPPDRPKGRGRALEPSELAELARAKGIELLQPANPHHPSVLERLRAQKPDILLVASYGLILKPSLLELAPHGALNVHASLLPRHRGASPVQAAILAGDTETGVSVQRIVEQLDAGDIVLMKSRPIDDHETAGELTAALAQLGSQAAVEALDAIEAGTAAFTPQDPARATYARKLAKSAGRIDWSRPAAELARFVRAMSPWPGARFTDQKGREVTVLSARALAAPAKAPSAAPGTVVETGERFAVAAGEGALELVALVPAGKRPMSGAEYLRGARLAAGEVLSSAGAR